MSISHNMVYPIETNYDLTNIFIWKIHSIMMEKKFGHITINFCRDKLYQLHLEELKQIRLEHVSSLRFCGLKQQNLRC